MTPIDIQVSRSKVKPILHMLGKGGISVLQTSIFWLRITDEGSSELLDDVYNEFPTINNDVLGSKSRYSYHCRLVMDESRVLFDGLIKQDVESGSSKTHEYSKDNFGGEAAFAPRQGATAEDDGYLITFVYNAREHSSELHILDAQHIEQPPLARIPIPRQAVAKHIAQQGWEVVDIGPTTPESTHYPKHGKAAAQAVASGDCGLGIILCGTGQGIMMAANKVPGIRCGVCSDAFSARMIRQHNNANMLSIGARVVGEGQALDIVDAFLGAEFEGGRHATRVDMIEAQGD